MHLVEKKYQTEGVVITVIIHALLLALFYFMILSTPNPPLESRVGIGGGGVDLILGDDPNAGMGDNSNLLPIQTATQEELNKEQTPEEPVEPSTPDDVKEETTTPTDLEDAVEIKATVSNEKKTETKKNETTEKKSEQKKEEVKYNFGNKNKSTTSNTSTTGGGMNNNKEGITGNKDGTSNGTRLYGQKGSGDGNGGGHGNGKGSGFGDGYGNWDWGGDPYPVDNSNEFGKMEFLLTVDEDGQIINVVPIKSYGISPTVQRLYMNHLKTLSVEPPNGVDITPGTKIPVWYTIKSKN